MQADTTLSQLPSHSLHLSVHYQGTGPYDLPDSLKGLTSWKSLPVQFWGTAVGTPRPALPVSISTSTTCTQTGHSTQYIKVSTREVGQCGPDAPSPKLVRQAQGQTTPPLFLPAYCYLVYKRIGVCTWFPLKATEAK